VQVSLTLDVVVEGLAKLDKVASRAQGDDRSRIAPIGGANMPPGTRTQGDQHVSRYADQPRSISEGASQALSEVRNGAAGGYQRISRDGVYGVPGAAFSSVHGLFMGISKVLMATRNVADGGARADAAQKKYKTQTG
jgi:hypothetical protein